MTTTIQKTSKTIKAHIVIASLVFGVGTVLLFQGNSNGSIMFLIGLLWLVCAKIAKWWHHD